MTKRTNGLYHSIYDTPSVGLEPTFSSGPVWHLAAMLTTRFVNVEDVTPQEEGLVQDFGHQYSIRAVVV